MPSSSGECARCIASTNAREAVRRALSAVSIASGNSVGLTVRTPVTSATGPVQAIGSSSISISSSAVIGSRAISASPARRSGRREDPRATLAGRGDVPQQDRGGARARPRGRPGARGGVPEARSSEAALGAVEISDEREEVARGKPIDECALASVTERGGDRAEERHPDRAGRRRVADGLSGSSSMSSSHRRMVRETVPSRREVTP